MPRRQNRLPTYHDSAHRKLREGNLNKLEGSDVILDILTQNLAPNVAQEVKESWVDPSTLCVKHLLGNGKWLCHFQNYENSAFPLECMF